jgi:hypothetical protein
MKVHHATDLPFAPADATKTKSSGAAFGNILEEVKGKGKQTPAEELAAYMKMTPAQRMAADLLKQMGLTQADLDAMPPAERKAITDKIAALVKQQMEAQAHAKKTPGVATL